MIKPARDDIIERAVSLFLERGYKNVTVNDICQVCGITKPTFYKYAGSKEELILDLYDRTVWKLVADPCLLLQADTHIERLLIIFHTLIEDTQKFGSDLFSQMLISNLNEDHHSFDMHESLTELGVTILQKAQEAGEILNADPPEILYALLAHLFAGHEVMWCIHNGQTPFANDFFEGFASILNVREDLRPLCKKYSSNYIPFIFHKS